MLSGGPGRRSRRECLFHKYLSSRKDDEMLKLIDSGCGQHQARQIALKGVTAALVDRLILNLPLTDGAHHYICEHGCTHRLTLHQPQEHVTSRPPGRGRAGGTVPAH